MTQFTAVLTSNKDTLSDQAKNLISGVLNENFESFRYIKFSKNPNFSYSFLVEIESNKRLHILDIELLIKVLNDEVYCYETHQFEMWECNHIDYDENNVDLI